MRAAHLGDGPDRRVEPLARYEPRDAGDHPCILGQTEVAACGGSLLCVEGTEALDVDTGRYDGRRQVTTGGTVRLVERVLPGGDDVASVSQHVGERLLGPGQSPGHGDLGAVEDHVVGQLERRPDEPERHGRVEHHELGTEVGGEVVDPLHHQRVRQQNRLPDTLDAIRLGGIELLGAGVRAGQHRELVGWEAAPPLPQQVLDPADLGWVVVGDEQMFHTTSRRGEASGGPIGMLAQEVVVVGPIPGEDPLGPFVGGVAHVAEDDQGVAPPPDRVAVRQVPASEALEQQVVGRFEQVEHIDPCLHGLLRVREVDAVLVAESDGRRADLLAVVAAVQTVAECLPVLDRERAGTLDQPREALVGVDDAGRDDRTGRAPIETSTTRTAPVGDRLADGILRSGDDRSEHEEAAGAGNQDVGVLAEPSEPAEVGDLTIHDGVVVGERDGPMIGTTDSSDDRTQPRAQRRIVVDPGVPADAGLRTLGPSGFVDRTVGPRRDDDGSSMLDGTTGSVERSGFRYVNPMSACRPASLRSSSAVRARSSTSAGATPRCAMPCSAAISVMSSQVGSGEGRRTPPVYRRSPRSAAPSAGDAVLQVGDEAGLAEQPNDPSLIEVEHERCFVVAPHQERDNAILAGGAALHGTVFA